MTSHSQEDQIVLDQLVYRVCRAFYEPKFIVAMDVINKMKQVKDEELAAQLKLTVREIHKICGKLKEDRLIKDLTKLESRKPDQRAIPKTYYYLDYKIFVDVVKYKIHRMGKQLDSAMSKQEVESETYQCQTCGLTHALVDVSNNFSAEYGLFLCPGCGNPVVEIKVEEDDKGQEMKTKLRENTKPIVDLLKLTDNIVIEQYTESMIAKNAAARTHDDDDLAFAEDGGQQQGEIQVVFQDDNDKAAKKKRETDAQKKRQENSVPVWHAWSTVSHEMTALGAAAAKRNEIPMDDTNADGEGEVTENDVERDEYIKQYYDNLANGTPEDEEESFEADDVNESRSSPKHGLDDDDEEESRKRHRADGNVSDQVAVDTNDQEEELYEEGGAVEYPEVPVAGRMVHLLEVTAEDQEKMSPDEYLFYYETCKQFQ